MFVSKRTFTTFYAHPHGSAPQMRVPCVITGHLPWLVPRGGTPTRPESRIANVSRPSAGEDAATNNIGSVTLLHERLRVQAESEEAGQIPSLFSRTSAASRVSCAPPLTGSAGAPRPWHVPVRAGRALGAGAAGQAPAADRGDCAAFPLTTGSGLAPAS